MGRRPKSGSLASVSLGTLQSELRRRQRSVGKIQKKRAKLAAKYAAKLAELDAQIKALGGSVTGGGMPGALAGGKRAKNDTNLVEALAGVLKGKTMGVSEAMEAVQKAGYVSTAANFRTIVNATLLKHKSKFKKVSRGQYTGA